MMEKKFLRVKSQQIRMMMVLSKENSNRNTLFVALVFVPACFTEVQGRKTGKEALRVF